MITLQSAHVEEMCAHAREANPAECCGLIGAADDHRARSIYRASNVAPDPRVGYEIAVRELLDAQRLMRERGEELWGIYHSHPRSIDPVPSETDVRLAYYPSAVYFIIGFSAGVAVLRAFRISEREGLWEPVEYGVAGE
ncbi:MAG: M67 family metallopeptidase [Pyrinomonadaceae bacterium]